ncbi:hypothetical protein [Photobacterium damselae]|uniref:hypothetical protein n=1 Tax=Photobacterium damselae TaxID=38293 RepID=UPI0040678A92
MKKVNSSSNKAIRSFHNKLSVLIYSAGIRFAVRVGRIMASIGVIYSIVAAAKNLEQQLLVAFPVLVMFLTVGVIFVGNGKYRSILLPFNAREKMCVLISALMSILSLTIASFDMYTEDYFFWCTWVLITVSIEYFVLLTTNLVAKSAIKCCIKDKDVLSSVILCSLVELVGKTSKENLQSFEKTVYNAQAKLFAISIGLTEVETKKDVQSLFTSAVNIVNMPLKETHGGFMDGATMYAMYTRFVRKTNGMLDVVSLDRAISMAKDTISSDTLKNFGEDRFTQRIGEIYKFAVNRQD